MGLNLRTLRIMTQYTTRLVEMIFPEQANHYGTLFGGNALNLLSKAAFLVANAPTFTAFAAPRGGAPLAWGGPAPASRHARGDMVMAACSEVKFLAPVRLGQALALTAHITRTGRSSMTIRVEGAAETLASGESHPALEGSFEMVAVDAQGQPVTCAHSKEKP